MNGSLFEEPQVFQSGYGWLNTHSPTTNPIEDIFLSAVLSVVYNLLWNSYISEQSSTSTESGMKMCRDQQLSFLILAGQAFTFESICLFFGFFLFIFWVREIQLPGAKLFVSYKQPSSQSSCGLWCCNFVVLAQYFVVAWACGDVMQWNYFVLFLEINQKKVSFTSIPSQK